MTFRKNVLVAAIPLLLASPALAHVMVFTPTTSVGTRTLGNPAEYTVAMTFDGASGSVFETGPANGGPPISGGQDQGVTAYEDALMHVSAVAGLLQLPGNSNTLIISSDRLFIDDIHEHDEVEVRGTVEGFGSDGPTPCGIETVGAFSGDCEASGYWTLDGAVVAGVVSEPGGLPVISAALGGLLLMLHRRKSNK